MNRKIGFFIIFLLIGCNENKITKKYLVGEWHCFLTEYESSEKDNKNFWKQTDEFEEVETYKLINNKLYIEDEEANPEFFDIDTKVNNEYMEIPINNGINGLVKISQIYTKISKDKYMLSVESESNIHTKTDNQYYFRKKSFLFVKSQIRSTT